MAILSSLMLFLVSSSLLLLFSCFPVRSHPAPICPAWICSPASIADRLQNLDSLRQNLVRQEDTIVFCLIERSRYPNNSGLYSDNKGPTAGFTNPHTSVLNSFIKDSEDIQAKFGRYTSEEESAFFPKYLPYQLMPSSKCTKVLHQQGGCINKNNEILEMYLKLVPSIAAAKEVDRDYAATAATDLTCLQALSRRIHFGKFVAEAKYKNASKKYIPAIRAKDKAGLEKLLTVKSVEDAVKERVKKKAMIFGQDVDNVGKYKVDPTIVYQLYNDYVIPFTKDVEVDYLLQRLS